MDDESKKLLREFLQNFSDAISSGREVLPTLTEDILRHGVMSNTVLAVFFLLAGIAMAVPACWLTKRWVANVRAGDRGHDYEGTPVGAFIFILLAIAFFLLACVSTIDALTAAYMPRVYVLDYIKNLIKSL